MMFVKKRDVERTMVKSMRTFILGLTLSILLNSCLSCRPRPSVEQKQWALATTGILTECNRENHNMLAGVECTEQSVAKHTMLLSDWWSINSRKDLLFVLDWIEQVGHRKRFDQMGQYMRTLNDEQFQNMFRQLPEEDKSSWDAVRRYWVGLGRKSLVGWDFCRYIHLCRKGYLLGYLREKEAWSLIMPKARLLQETFDSWRDLGENYLIGREFWSLATTKASGWFYYEAFKRLVDEPDSPWNTIPWKLDLE